jgi:hypothetical protein
MCGLASFYIAHAFMLCLRGLRTLSVGLHVCHIYARWRRPHMMHSEHPELPWHDASDSSNSKGPPALWGIE